MEALMISKAVTVKRDSQSPQVSEGSLKSISRKSKVFITGSTGLVGGEITRMIAPEIHQAYCLIRNMPMQPGSRRLEERLGHKFSDACLPVPFSGDLLIPNLGLSTPMIASLQEIDFVIHCAAETSFLKGKNCDDTNITGTAHLIDLVKKFPKKPCIVYISTASNIGKIHDQNLKEDFERLSPNNHHNKYTRSKAIAETMVRESGLEHLILKPSIVLSAGLNNRTFARQILWFAPLLGMFDALPFRPDSRVDALPVSTVSDWAVRLLKTGKRTFDTYHLSSGSESLPMSDWVQIVSDFYGRKKPLRLIPPADWGRAERRHFIKTDAQRRFYHALSHYFPFINMNVIYDHTRLQKDIGALKIPNPSSYLPGLLSQIDMREAEIESIKP